MSGLLVVDKLSRGKALVRVVATPAVPASWLPFHELRLFDSDGVQRHVPGSYAPGDAPPRPFAPPPVPQLAPPPKARRKAARSRRVGAPKAAAAAPPPPPPCCDAPLPNMARRRAGVLLPGDRVRAEWDEGTGNYHTAQVTRVDDDGAKVDLLFDDGAWWEGAPRRVVAPPCLN